MGALPEQTAEFGFGGSLQQKGDPWLDSDGFGTLHNCVQDKTGALEKHPGYSAFGVNMRNGDSVPVAPIGALMDVPGVTIGNAPKLIKRGDQVAALSDGLLLAKADEWTLQGRVSPWVCEQRTVCQADGDKMDCCCSGNWVYSAFETAAGGVNVAATYLPSNKTTIVFTGGHGGSLPTTGVSEPRIVAIDNVGTAILFVMYPGAQGKYHVITPDGVTAAQLVTLKSGYDVVSDPGTAQVWTVYLTSAVNVQSDHYSFAAGTLNTLGASPNATTGATVCSISVDVSTNRLALCWAAIVGGSLTVMAISRSTDYVTTLYWSARAIWNDAAGTTISNIGITLSPADGHFIAFTDNRRQQVTGRWVSLTGVVQGALGVISGDVAAPLCFARSRPAWDGKRMFLLADVSWLSTAGAIRRGHFVLGIEPRSFAGKASPVVERFGVLGAFSYLTAVGGSRMPRPFVDSSGVWHLQGLEIGGQAASLQLLCDYALFADDRVGVAAELGKATYITGAVLSQWDGVRVCEAAFLTDPFAPQLSQTAGGSMALGSYTYAITYGRSTAAGETVRSRPSLTSTLGIVAAGTQSMTVTTAPPGPSNLVNNDESTIIAVEVWRSEVGTTSPLYLASRVFFGLLNATDVAFVDARASYLGNEQLYSDGTNGEIANSPPASPLSLCQWRNRLWLTDGEQIFYTKEAAATRGAEWSQAFFVMPRGAPERLTSVAPLGEVLMAFSADRSSYVYGDGPGANGDGSTLTGPMPLVSELGCTQAAGIAQLPDGLLVPTRRGLHVLSGKREFAYIGAAIEDTLAALPRVRCARHISGTNRVWISLTDQALTDGIAVIYDTHHKTFSTVFSQAEMFGVNMKHCSSVDVGGVHMFAVQDGHVYVRSSSSFLLDAARYGQAIETPWFKASGPSGEVRARRFLALMKRMGTSVLQIEIGYDYEDTYHYSMLVHDAELQLMEGEPDTLKPRIPFPRQRCQAYRMRFTEVPAVASSAGFRFVSLRMTISQRPGSGKLLSKLNSPAAFTKS